MFHTETDFSSKYSIYSTDMSLFVFYSQTDIPILQSYALFLLGSPGMDDVQCSLHQEVLELRDFHKDSFSVVTLFSVLSSLTPENVARP